MGLAVPRHNINFNFREYLIALRAAFARPASSGDVRAFEQAVAAYLGVGHCVAFASGSAALFHGLSESGLKADDAIIVPSYEFPSVIETIRLCSFTPVFAEVSRASGNLKLEGIKSAYREDVRAVLVANINGMPANLPEIAAWCEEKNLLLIEDCAHSLGSSIRGRKTGTFGRFAIFSFGSGKPLTTCSGGMLATLDDALAARLREKQRAFTVPGWGQEAVRMISTAIKALVSTRLLFTLTLFPLVLASTKLTRKIFLDKLLLEPSGPLSAPPPEYTTAFTDGAARIGLSQLARLEALNEARHRNAYALRKRLADRIEFLFDDPGPEVFNLCLNAAVEVPGALAFRKKLLAKGVDTRPDYLVLYDDAYPKGQVPADRIYLPNHPALSEKDIDRIVRVIKEIVK